MSTFDSAEGHRRVHIIDDLLGAVLVLAALGFVLLLELTRRRICAVYQLAFVLCAVCTFFVFGGIVDHHLTNEQLTLALYGSYLSSSLTTSYVYLPILTALGVSFAALVQLSLCSCQCCCLVGAASVAHSDCFAARIRANMSLYSTSFVALIGAIGARLNARLRESAINPEGGTVHWNLLRAPFFLAMAHIGSLLFVALKLFLQHADRTSIDAPRAEHLLGRVPPTTIEDLTRAPPAPKKLPPLSASTEKKINRTRSPTSSSAASALSDALAAREGQRRELQLSVAAAPDRINRSNNNHDGDVSSLISSDSEDDDEVLQPVFKSVAAAAAIRRAASPQRSAYSGYSSSPPASPTSSIDSSLSTSPIARARARRYRNGGANNESSPWSDYEDTIDRLSTRDYYSDRPSTASTSSTASIHGLRRRANAANNSSTYRHLTALPQLVETRVQAPSESPWIPCVDPASGSTYYYNQQTGESRWDLV
ncbi:WW domain-containing protein [Phytophthora infestans]|uniref:WW domain-containing protein n=1 Tax=Phytophthora infestans TaxID=4787 RepID=A0A8S9U4X6_PHYIN|nr:WW domain-containing protein [Phytophthora infestans]